MTSVHGVAPGGGAGPASAAHGAGGAMSRDEFERRLVDFVNRTLVRGTGGAAATLAHADTLLFEEGFVNSLRILDLIAFVELTLGTKVPDKAIRLQNFRSVRVIARYFVGEGADGAA